MGDHIRTPRGSNPIIPPLQIGRGRYIRTSTEASRHVSTSTEASRHVSTSTEARRHVST